MKQTGINTLFTLIVGLTLGLCAFFLIVGGVLGGFFTLFLNFTAGLVGGGTMIGFGIFLIIAILVIAKIYFGIYKNE